MTRHPRPMTPAENALWTGIIVAVAILTLLTNGHEAHSKRKAATSAACYAAGTGHPVQMIDDHCFVQVAPGQWAEPGIDERSANVSVSLND